VTPTIIFMIRFIVALLVGGLCGWLTSLSARPFRVLAIDPWRVFWKGVTPAFVAGYALSALEEQESGLNAAGVALGLLFLCGLLQRCVYDFGVDSGLACDVG
jgi:hypothetical protein